ncbi:MAG TPA: GNAT family N-acetyltransferase [Gaiellales bacterium]|jgi:GNAT superfamily N-acetyltransferase|nr:GNAT family N-acetyltransferase [Gaiellales bacterium]
MTSAREVTVARFSDALRPLFDADPIRNSLPMGIVDVILRRPEQYPGAITWLAEDEHATAVAGVLRTPPFPAIAIGDPGALPAVAAAMYEASVELPGANGLEPSAEAFAAAWCARSGATPVVRMRTTLHALDALEEVPHPAGMVREARPDDREILVGWFEEFAAEAGVGGTRDQHIHSLNAAMDAEAGALIWDDGGPTSFSLARWTSPAHARIGPVYTPPRHRRRGYATALVAEHTRHLLRAGACTCLLYTDQANPTSNAIYGRIGYRPLCDAAEIAFEPG